MRRRAGRHRNIAGIAAVFLVALTGCASSDGAAAPTATLAAPDPRATSAVTEPDYRIGPSDILEVSVFQVPDLTRSVQVDANGHVALPLIGQVEAAGQTAAGLSEVIAGKLGARYLRSPQVTVFVQQAQSQKITVEGAVSQSGIFALTGRTTLLQAVALAKGTDQYADTRHVIVFRNVDRQRMAAVFDLKGIETGRSSDPQIFGNDVVVVNPSSGKKLFYNLVQSAGLLALFRPY